MNNTDDGRWPTEAQMKARGPGPAVAATAGSAGAMRLEGLLARLKAIPDEKVAGDDARTGITYGFLRDFIRAFAAALAAPQAQEAATPPSVDMTALAGRLADMIIMLDAPDAYRRDYIAAVCRATLSMVSRPNQLGDGK